MTFAHIESHSVGALLRNTLIGITAFLTLVDLFATQAILPSLAARYHSSPGMVGFAVNASTLGMAIAALLVALFSGRIDRRLGIFVSLAVLSIPTVLLAFAPSLTIFTLLRVVDEYVVPITAGSIAESAGVVRLFLKLMYGVVPAFIDRDLVPTIFCCAAVSPMILVSPVALPRR